MAVKSERFENFLVLAKKKHLNFYDYSKVEYNNNNKDIIIICPEHGEFITTPYKHIHSTNTGKCPNCYTSQITTLDGFISKSKIIHNNMYDYSKFIYSKTYNKSIIICPVHGEFLQSPAIHLSGSSCFKCSQMYTLKDFITKAKIKHNNLYTYKNFTYNGTYSKSLITCKQHGDFKQCSNDHLNGVGCPICKLSKGELKIKNFLEKNGYVYIQEKKFKSLGQLRFDFYLPDYNIIIEFDGKQHFEESSKFGGKNGLLKVQNNDKIKNEYCSNNNIQIIRIKYTEIKIIDKILDTEIIKEP